MSLRGLHKTVHSGRVGAVNLVRVAASVGKSISIYNQPPGSTEPGHPSVGRHNE